jgi:hypothetical protein
VSHFAQRLNGFIDSKELELERESFSFCFEKGSLAVVSSQWEIIFFIVCLENFDQIGVHYLDILHC